MVLRQFPLTETLDPELISLTLAVHDVVLGTALELLLPKLDAAFDLDLVHASFLFFSLDIVCGDEEPLERIVLFDT